MKTRYLCLTAAVLVVVLATVSSNASAELVGYWSFDGNANDGGAYGNNGTATDVTYTSSLPSELSSHSQSASFNGSSSDVKVAYNDSLYCNSAITISFWMKAAEADQTAAGWVRAFSNIGGSTYGMEFQKDGPNVSGLSLRIDTAKSGDRFNQCQSIGNAFDNTWHHIAITADSSGAVTTYFDGVGTTRSFLYNPGFGSTSDLRFGNSMNEASDWLNGSMADAAIWNNVLSGSQIAALASGSATPLTIPEPSSVALLTAALAGLLAYAWRKQK